MLTLDFRNQKCMGCALASILVVRAAAHRLKCCGFDSQSKTSTSVAGSIPTRLRVRGNQSTCLPHIRFSLSHTLIPPFHLFSKDQWENGWGLILKSMDWNPVYHLLAVDPDKLLIKCDYTTFYKYCVLLLWLSLAYRNKPCRVVDVFIAIIYKRNYHLSQNIFNKSISVHVLLARTSYRNRTWSQL